MKIKKLFSLDEESVKRLEELSKKLKIKQSSIVDVLLKKQILEEITAIEDILK